jgi:hypothetical protein
VSYRVLVIPEDPTNNGYILRPLVARMLDECGKTHAKIQILTNPKSDGYEHAKRLIREEVIERYAHFDLLLFLPDADGKDRSAEFAAMEGEAEMKHVLLICCAAVQEVEAWLLAGHLEKINRSWADLRQDVSVKETAFEPFLAGDGDARRPGAGRDLLMNEALSHYDALLGRCPELKRLQERIYAAFSND